VLLLDVRTPEEFNGTAPDKFGKLSGAINIPVQELEKRTVELSKYKNKEILVYCSHSHRSPQASYILMQNGFTKVTNMQLGMSEWKNKVQDNKCNNSLYVAQ
jgi:rhodanese-related sulfurtransferase